MKLFVNELGTQAMVKFAEETEDRWKAISVLAPLEVRSAIRRRELTGDIALDDAAVACEFLEQESRRVVQQTITAGVIEKALSVVDRHTLRALDATQLASALVLRESFGSSEVVRFISSDRRLLQAAQAEGLAIWDPSGAP